MEISGLMDEVEDLLHVPDVGQSLYHKIQELKVTMSKSIHMFREVTESLEPKQSSPDEPDVGRDFELIRFGKKTWIPAIPGEVGVNGFAVVPQPVIDHIIKSKPEPGLSNMQRGVKLAELAGKAFDLTFERTGDRVIRGTIVHRSLDLSSLLLPDSGMIAGHEEDLMPCMDNGQKIKKIKLLLSYLMVDEEYMDAAYSDFCSLWKPVIDKRHSHHANAT